MNSAKNNFAPNIDGWDESLSLGIPVIDAQHRHFISIIIQLDKAEHAQQTEKTAVDLLKNLLFYIQAHFQTEEDFMNLHFHSALAAHKDEHRIFTGMVRRYSQSLRDGNQEAVAEVRAILKDWLMNHIKTMDAAYAVEAKKIASEEKLFLLFSGMI